MSGPPKIRLLAPGLERASRLLDRASGVLGRVLGFAHFVGQRFIAERGLQVAASLAYTSLLSLVPLMAVTLSMLAAFPDFRSLGQDLQDFIFSNFVPAAGKVVQSYLQDFAQKASRLTSVGIGVLVVTALMMMWTIDGALNAIWRSQGRRSAVASFIVYWAVLTLGPMLVGMGVVATSYLSSLLVLSETESIRALKSWALIWLPFVSTSLAFTLLYVVVPARRVPLFSALIGGVFAASLFESAKRGFAWYVIHFPTYETIYGALATIPIFLVWIYVSWVIIILGAVLTHSLSVFKEHVAARQTLPPGQRMVMATRLVGHLWDAQRRGEACSDVRLLELEPMAREDGAMALGVLQDLEAGRWVHHRDTGEWALSRDVSDLTLLDLYRTVPGPLPEGLEATGRATDTWDEALGEILRAVGQDLEGTLAVPLKDLYRDRSSGPARTGIEGEAPPQTVEASPSPRRAGAGS